MLFLSLPTARNIFTHLRKPRWRHIYFYTSVRRWDNKWNVLYGLLKINYDFLKAVIIKIIEYIKHWTLWQYTQYIMKFSTQHVSAVMWYFLVISIEWVISRRNIHIYAVSSAEKNCFVSDRPVFWIGFYWRRFSVARLIKLVQSCECHNKAKHHLN